MNSFWKGKSRDVWLDEYSESHRHPFNRACHLAGIPMISASLPLFGLLAWRPAYWPLPVGLFSVGWILQFLGHAVEGRPPEFLRDWRFFLVGFSWWLRKVRERDASQ